LKYEENLLDAAGIVVCPDGLSIGRGRLEDGETYCEEEEVFFGSGCCIMCRKVMLEDVRTGDSYFDEDFFMYADDTDLGWRARLRGWKCIYTPGAKVYHLHSASSETYSPLKAFLVERNRIWIQVKCFPAALIFHGFLFTFLRYLFQTYGAFAGKGAAGEFAGRHSKVDLAAILLRAWIAVFRSLPSLLPKRRVIQDRRLIGTGEIRHLLNQYGIGAKTIGLKR
jgi:GT2 family glycosyltransferase